MLSFVLLAVLGQVTVDYRPIYEPGEPIVFKVKGAATTASVNWKFKGLRTLPGAATTEVHGWGAPGKYTGRCTVIDWSAKTFVDEDLEFEIRGTTPPLPPDPVPPGPGPVPPGPVPPSPIPGDGLKVLIKYESAKLAAMPSAQLSLIYSAAFRQYLDTVCVVGPDGKTKEWRMYDKDVSLAGESERWKAAMTRPSTQEPWIIVSNATTGYEGPLPANVDEAKALIAKYAGK